MGKVFKGMMLALEEKIGAVINTLDRLRRYAETYAEEEALTECMNALYEIKREIGKLCLPEKEKKVLMKALDSFLYWQKRYIIDDKVFEKERLSKEEKEEREIANRLRWEVIPKLPTCQTRSEGKHWLFGKV